MSVVGIDFGNANNVVALARRKWIDVVLNDESKRETPSMINFGEKQARGATRRDDRARTRAKRRMEMKLLLFHSSSEREGRARGIDGDGGGTTRGVKTDDWWMIFATAAIRRVRGGG